MIVDPYRYLRDRQAALIAQMDRGSTDPPDTTARIVGQVFDNGSLPTTTGKYFAVHPVTVGGTESEGSPGTFDVDSSTVLYFLVLGPKVPAVGDYLIGHSIGGRWVARRGKKHAADTVSVPGCPCTATPQTLTMTSSKPQSNFGMFQNATLRYGPTPAWAAPLALGSASYLSTANFVDGVTGDSFQYYLGCFQGYYILTRVYQTSVYGSPFRDIVRYKWLIGLAGNSCSPFQLSNGQVYAGGDPTCTVSFTS